MLHSLIYFGCYSIQQIGFAFERGAQNSFKARCAILLTTTAKSFKGGKIKPQNGGNKIKKVGVTLIQVDS